MLDLVFISDELKASRVECLTPVSVNTQHHKALTVEFTFYDYEAVYKNCASERIFCKANWDIMKNNLSSINWSN